jgi:hypothetical protein
MIRITLGEDQAIKFAHEPLPAQPAAPASPGSG